MKAVLIGTGMVAGMHADAIANSGGKVTLHGVLARRTESARAFADTHGGKVYSTIEEVAADPQVDMAIVVTPPDARDHIARILAEAGTPTLMEKPLERDTVRAREIVATYNRTDTPLGAVLQHRMRAAVAALRDRLPDLGQIGSVEVRVPWWRPQSYYDAPGRGTYARDGGGVLITQAIHTLDLMLHLLGPVTSVQGIAATTALHQMESEDFAAAGLRFASGAVGAVTTSTSHYPGGAEEIIINGTLASAHLCGDTLTIHRRDADPEQIGVAAATGGGADPMAFSSDWHRAVIEDFAQAVAEGRAPSITAEDALGVHVLIDAITLSAREGRTVETATI